MACGGVVGVVTCVRVHGLFAFMYVRVECGIVSVVGAVE